jgi:hypothetical protein
MAKHGAVFEARYRGRCGVGGDDIEPGDDVCYLDDEVCHECCAEDAED